MTDDPTKLILAILTAAAWYGLFSHRDEYRTDLVMHSFRMWFVLGMNIIALFMK